MGKKKKNRIFLLLILLLGISIGFAALTTTLKINGNASITKNTWNIYWDSIGNEDGITPATGHETSIGPDENDVPLSLVTWSVTFNQPGDYYEFQVDAVNGGTIDAEILSIEKKYNGVAIDTQNPLPSYLKYTVTYVDNGEVPAVGDKLLKRDDSTTPFTPTRRRYKVRVEYDRNAVTNADVNNQVGDVTHTFGFAVNYGQATPSQGNKVAAKIGNDSIANMTDTQIKNAIGEDVTGVLTNKNSDWQLFYVDNDYIYLIAKDYIRVNNLPDELEKQTGDSDSTPKYMATFGTQQPTDNFRVTGTIMDTAPWSNGSAANVLTTNPLTSTYIKWVAANSTSTNTNIKATAYIMDREIWSDFAGDIDGAFAMGGPTLEMFVLSYNEKHETKLSTYSSITSSNANQYGYFIKKEEDENWDNYIYNLNNDAGTMWFKNDQSKAPAYWLAGPVEDPSTNNTSDQRQYSAWYNGTLLGQYIDFERNNYVGFRPLLAIPKSSLE